MYFSINLVWTTGIRLERLVRMVHEVKIMLLIKRSCAGQVTARRDVVVGHVTRAISQEVT